MPKHLIAIPVVTELPDPAGLPEGFPVYFDGGQHILVNGTWEPTGGGGGEGVGFTTFTGSSSGPWSEGYVLGHYVGLDEDEEGHLQSLDEAVTYRFILAGEGINFYPPQSTVLAETTAMGASAGLYGDCSDATALGAFATCDDSPGSTVVGAWAAAWEASGGVAFGDSAYAESAGSVAIGEGSYSYGRSVVVGPEAFSNDFGGTAVGSDAGAGAGGATAVGADAYAGHENAVALGANASTSANDQVAVGNRDVELQGDGRGVFLRSPDGTRFKVTVDNTGALTVVATP